MATPGGGVLTWKMYAPARTESNFEKSVSYQNKDGPGNAPPTFFWYDNDKDLFCFPMTCVTLPCKRLLPVFTKEVKVSPEIMQISLKRAGGPLKITKGHTCTMLVTSLV